MRPNILKNKKTRDIYEKYLIEYIYPYHALTDTDSTCLFFIFVCKPEGAFSDETYRNCPFEVIVSNEVFYRLDTSHEFWEKFRNLIPET